ncbi:MAG: amidohydrolase family protein [Armatimonadota bacterium]
MIVDCHVHVKGGCKYRREFRPSQILQVMDEAGVDRSVIFAMSLPSRASNALTMDCYNEDPDRFIPFAHVLPQERQGAVEELTRCFDELGMRGLKLHCGEMQEPSLHLLRPILELCVAQQAPVLIDMAYNLSLAREIADAFPDLKLIIAHLGAPDDEDMAEQFIVLAGQHPNIHLDTSYCHRPWKILEAIERLGADRVIFGSDGPIIHPTIELAKIEVCNLSDEDYERVTAENILRLLRPL